MSKANSKLFVHLSLKFSRQKISTEHVKILLHKIRIGTKNNFAIIGWQLNTYKYNTVKIALGSFHSLNSKLSGDDQRSWHPFRSHTNISCVTNLLLHNYWPVKFFFFIQVLNILWRLHGASLLAVTSAWHSATPNPASTREWGCGSPCSGGCWGQSKLIISFLSFH